MGIISNIIENAGKGKFLEQADEAAGKREDYAELLEAHEEALRDPFYKIRAPFLHLTNPDGTVTEGDLDRSKAGLRELDTLSLNISNRLLNEGIDQSHWEAASEAERDRMVDSAVRIMAEEAHLPQEVLSRLKIERGDVGTDRKGRCNLFVMRVGDDAFALRPEVDPTIRLSDGLSREEDIIFPLICASHQTTLLLEQACLTEPAGAFWHIPVREHWAGEADVSRYGERESDLYWRQFPGDAPNMVWNNAALDTEMQLYARLMDEKLAKFYKKSAKFGAGGK